MHSNNDHSGNNDILDFEPIEIIANLDMVGELLCQILVAQEDGARAMKDGDMEAAQKAIAGIPPLAVQESAVIILRNLRDHLAGKYKIGQEVQYRNPEYLACLAFRDLQTDGVIGENMRGA